MAESRVVQKELNELLDNGVDVGLFPIKLDFVRESVIIRFLKDRGWLEEPAHES